MSERYTKEMFEADLKKREEKEAKEQRERASKAERESALRAWKKDGGEEADFDKVWANIRDKARIERVAEADRKAREAARETTRARF